MIPKDTETILEPSSSEGEKYDPTAADDQDSKKRSGRKLWKWRLEGMTIIVLSVIVLSAALTVALVISILAGLTQMKPHGTVATEDEQCTRAGLSIMQHHGGNAVDAAVTSALCMAVTRPDVASLAGCGLVLVRDRKTQKSSLFDFSCTAPFDPPPPNSAQPQTLVGVPGYVRGLKVLHRQLGIKPWSLLFGTAIQLATDGFKPSDILLKNAQQAVADNPTGAGQIATELNGFAGGVYKPIASLQETLYNLANNGADQFYDTSRSGSFGNRLYSFMSAFPLPWTVANILNYAVEQPEPIQMGFAGFTLDAFPTPSSGGPFILSVLGNLDLKDAISPLNPRALLENEANATATFMHRLIELSRLAEESVSSLGDLYDTTIASEVKAAQQNLFTATSREDMVNKVDDATALPQSATEQPELDIGDTGILTTDSDRLTVVMTSYLGAPFGNGQLVPATGVHLNAALRLFSTATSTDPANPIFNTPVTGRRPLVPASPVYLAAMHRKCGIRVGVASGGGMWGTEDVVQVIANAVLFLQGTSCHSTEGYNSPVAATETDRVLSSQPVDNKKSHPRMSRFTPAAENGCIDSDTAIALPRLHSDVSDGTNDEGRVLYETHFSTLVSRYLTERGHNLTRQTKRWPGRVALVGWNGYEMVSSADVRGSWNLLSY